jgi:hypothetical protein
MQPGDVRDDRASLALVLPSPPGIPAIGAGTCTTFWPLLASTPSSSDAIGLTRPAAVRRRAGLPGRPDPRSDASDQRPSPTADACHPRQSPQHDGRPSRALRPARATFPAVTRPVLS